jgi:hypothetical protein
MSDTGLTHQQVKVLDKFRRRIKKERFLNNQASVYYTKQNSKFVIPGILITGISSIASFMATSDILGDDSKKGFSVGVGIMTAGATILQSISSSFGFQSRAEQFQKAADSYDTLLTKIEFELANPDEDFNEFCSDIESAILTIKNDCKYLPPLFIYKLWEEHKNGKFVKCDESENVSNVSGSINHILPTSLKIPYIVNSINSNTSDVKELVSTTIDIDTDKDEIVNTDNNNKEKKEKKNIVNETTSLFQDADEKGQQHSDYRSINFVNGMTTPLDNITNENNNKSNLHKNFENTI